MKRKFTHEIPLVSGDGRHWSIACKHPSSTVRITYDRANRPVYRHQCDVCGDVHGPAISKADVIKNGDFHFLTEIDGDIIEYAERRRQERIDQANAEWWEWYENYLLSDTWREKRERVLKRANFTCEGCRLKPATQVHHRSYANVGNEFLWDLVAICTDCHDRIHTPIGV